MSLDKLISQTKKTEPPSRKPPHLRIPSWLLPGGLVAGFIAVFALLFGSRLLPAVPVETVPVVTLRTAPGAQPSRGAGTERGSRIAGRETLLFQASGWIEPDPYTTYVPTLVDGVVEEVHILEGDSVQQGQLLATLVDEDAALDVQEAEQRIASTISSREAHCAAIPIFEAEQAAARKKIAAEEARLAELEDLYNRLKSVTRGAVPEQELIKARLQVARQQAALEETRTELPRIAAELSRVQAERKAIDTKLQEQKTNLARKQLALSRTRITAPMDGIVLRLHAAPGKKRRLGMDDPKSAVIVELYEPDKLQARIDVPLNEAAGLRVGQPVKLTTDLLPDLHLRGTVTRLVGEADVQRNTLQAKVRIDNPDPRLRPEMLVRAEFYPLPRETQQAGKPSSTANGGSGRLALYAPKAALFGLTGKLAKTWIVDDDRARLREVVVTDIEREDHLLVAEGLRSGERLILPPHDRLEPGKRVRPVN